MRSVLGLRAVVAVSCCSCLPNNLRSQSPHIACVLFDRWEVPERIESRLQLLGAGASRHEVGDLRGFFVGVEYVKERCGIAEVHVGLFVFRLQNFQNPEIAPDALDVRFP